MPAESSVVGCGLNLPVALLALWKPLPAAAAGVILACFWSPSRWSSVGGSWRSSGR